MARTAVSARRGGCQVLVVELWAGTERCCGHRCHWAGRLSASECTMATEFFFFGGGGGAGGLNNCYSHIVYFDLVR